MQIHVLIIRLIDRFNKIRKSILRFLDAIGILAAFSGFFVLIYHVGFEHDLLHITGIHQLYNVILAVILISNLAGIGLKSWKSKALNLRIAELSLIPLILLLLDVRVGIPGILKPDSWFFILLNHNLFVYGIILFILVVETSTSTLRLSNRTANPALLFVGSFLLIIVFGAGLLLLPTATYNGLSITDAFFTSTSAVCVTGLIVFDTAKQFTPLGQAIILVLIQVGGLGIMTFTSFFGYFFKGGGSFGNEFLIKELINEEKLGEIFKTLLKIVTVTISIEAIGALIIYISVPRSLFVSQLDLMGFSVFHAVSAFCNAGFSTLSNGLYEPGFRYNYMLHYIIGFLIILGGIGFPIVLNFYRLLRHFISNSIRRITLHRKYVHVPNIINAGTRIAVITTAVLLATGFVFFLIAEYNHSLSGLSLQGKIAGAFFGSVTPRTAGFNTVDMMKVAPATILLYFLLMWIGASPASTGGGIKTTTFAMALMNVISIARGKDRIEVFGRQIPIESMRRASAVIFLSLLVIGIAVIILSVTEPGIELSRIVFEVISAYGTVGLSLGLTATLSTAGKWVIIVTMFLGRVGMLTILIGMFRKISSLRYQYPSENILIN